MATLVDATIVTAIRERRLLRFTYHGHIRLVHPHTYGTTQKGRMALRAYQVGGTTGSGHTPDWRIFRFADMRDATLLTDTFAGAAPDYKPNDPAFATIVAQL